IVFNTLFGLSTTYWMAIVTRGLLGLLCGILGPIKIVLNKLFGLSTTYWMAIVTRGLLGLLCGILGPIK
ncbi:hypothetical protein ACJX0J_041971, partial [Zea mays]